MQEERAEGREEGRVEGEEIGRTKERISAIQALMNTMKWTAQQAMDAFGYIFSGSDALYFHVVKKAVLSKNGSLLKRSFLCKNSI